MSLFKNTREEFERYRYVAKGLQFHRKIWFIATYETKPKLIEEVLPPKINPICRPLVQLIMFDCSYSDVPGKVAPRQRFGYREATMKIPCECEGKQGSYVLSINVDTDQAILSGREWVGYPKKLARVRINELWQRNEVIGTAERQGIEYLNMKLKLRDKIPIPTELKSGASITVKWTPDVTGWFEYKPKIVYRPWILVGEPEVCRKADCEITFKEAPDDPIYQMEIVKIISCEYLRECTHASLPKDIIATLEPEEIIPYTLIRYKGVQYSR